MTFGTDEMEFTAVPALTERLADRGEPIAGTEGAGAGLSCVTVESVVS